MRLYPAYIKLEGTNCVVIGGGTVAWRKVKTLLTCKANVLVVSPHLCKNLKAMHGKKKIVYRKSAYKKVFLKNTFMVIAATDDEQVNARIAKDAKSKKILYNIVDSPNQCNFYVPSVIESGDLLLSISTQGAFAGLSKKIKGECAPVLDKYAVNLKVLSRIREQIKQEIKAPKLRRKLIQGLLDDKVINLVKRKKIDSLKEYKTFLNKK